MNLPHWTHYLGKTALLAAALTALATVGAPPSRADHNVQCQKRISKADHKLHEAIEHHGYKSSQAEHARVDLREAREHCYTTYHEWWDEDPRPGTPIATGKMKITSTTTSTRKTS